MISSDSPFCFQNKHITHALFFWKIYVYAFWFIVSECHNFFASHVGIESWNIVNQCLAVAYSFKWALIIYLSFFFFWFSICEREVLGITYYLIFGLYFSNDTLQNLFKLTFFNLVFDCIPIYFC